MSYYLLLRASEGQGTSLTMNRLHSGSLYPAAARASSADALSGNRCIVLWCYVGVNVQMVRRPRTSELGTCVTRPMPSLGGASLFIAQGARIISGQLPPVRRICGAVTLSLSVVATVASPL
jgi:hypothetical protein